MIMKYVNLTNNMPRIKQEKESGFVFCISEQKKGSDSVVSSMTAGDDIFITHYSINTKYSHLMDPQALLDCKNNWVTNNISYK